jgi:hypothetical protein
MSQASPMKSRLAHSTGSASVPDVKGNPITLAGDLLITDYSGHPEFSMVWQVDRTPITDPLKIEAVLQGGIIARSLPGLGVFYTREIDVAIARGVLTLI